MKKRHMKNGEFFSLSENHKLFDNQSLCGQEVGPWLKSLVTTDTSGWAAKI
jgi:hypothetical protein